MIKKVSFLMFMVSLSLQGQVDESESALRTFSLQQAQNYSLQHSYLIRNQVYEIEKAKKTIKETAALYFPQISANVDMTHNAIIQPIAFPTDPDQNPFAPPSTPGTPAPENDFQYITLGGGKYQNTWGVRANWMIGSYSNFLAKQASEVLKETRQLDKEEAEISIKADVAKAFYRVLVWEESVRLLRENLEPLQKSLFENRQLFQNGFVEEQDVNQVELLVSNLDNSLENAKRQRELAMQMLKYQMGIPLEQEIRLSGELDDGMEKVEAEMLNISQKKLVYEEHVTYRKVNSQYKASVLQLKNEKADRYPTLSFNANYSNLYVTNDFSENYFDTYWAPGASVTGSIKWDLFKGLSREAQIQKAEIDLDRAELQKEQVANQLKLTYHQARSNFLFAMANYRNAKKNVELSKKIRDNTMLKFSEGISSSLEFSQAENQYIENQRSYINAMQSLLFAKEELDKAMGQ